MAIRHVLGWSWLVGVVSLATAVQGEELADRSSRTWSSNVATALERVDSELGQPAGANDSRALRGVLANLKATLALYDADEDRSIVVVALEAPTEDDRTEESKRENRRRGMEREAAVVRERYEAARKAVERAEAPFHSEAKRLKEDIRRRHEEMHQRIVQEKELLKKRLEQERQAAVRERQAREDDRRSEEPDPAHRRIGRALREQQRQIEAMAERLERLERQVGEMRRGAKPTKPNSVRDHWSEGPRQDASRDVKDWQWDAAKRMDERQVLMEHLKQLQEVHREVSNSVQEWDQKKRVLQASVEQAKRLAAKSATEAKEKSRELKEVERITEELNAKRDQIRKKMQERMEQYRKQRLEQNERPSDRDPPQRDRRRPDRRETRKPTVPAEMI